MTEQQIATMRAALERCARVLDEQLNGDGATLQDIDRAAYETTNALRIADGLPELPPHISTLKIPRMRIESGSR